MLRSSRVVENMGSCAATPTAATLFVSYSRAQWEIAAGLASWLRSAGFTTWFDDTIAGGQAWWDQILREIRKCDVLLACVSEDYRASDACDKERAYALAWNRNILPLRVTEITADQGPSELNQWQWVK